MDFVRYRDEMYRHFEKLKASGAPAFVVDYNGDEMYDLYQNSFPGNSNGIYRVRRTHDCSSCKHFIRRAGGVVFLQNGKLITIWDFTTGDPTYDAVSEKMAEYVRSKPIYSAFISDTKRVGLEHDVELVSETNTTMTWTHFYIDVDERTMYSRDNKPQLIEEHRTNFQVFKRGMDEITPEAYEQVLDLIDDNNLYRGTENAGKIREMYNYQKEYLKLDNEQAKIFYCWETSRKTPAAVCRLKNSSIGTLLVDLSTGTDLETAVNEAVQSFVKWQSGKLGRDINPSYLVGLLMQTGIKRVVVTSPVFTPLNDGSDENAPQVGLTRTVNIINGGYENE